MIEQYKEKRPRDKPDIHIDDAENETNEEHSTEVLVSAKGKNNEQFSSFHPKIIK